MADVAHLLHFGAAELWDMPVDELMQWHQQAQRIARQSQ